MVGCVSDCCGKPLRYGRGRIGGLIRCSKCGLICNENKKGCGNKCMDNEEGLYNE